RPYSGNLYSVVTAMYDAAEIPLRKKLLNLWDHHGTAFLKVALAGVLIGRLLFPFFYNPVDYIYSDMQRHVSNGYNLLDPTYLNAMDPKGYQLWIRMLFLFPYKQARAFDGLFNGLLCAGLPWCWYKALCEITTRNKARFLAIV